MTDEKIEITKQSKDKILELAKLMLARGHIKDSIITALSPIAEDKDLEEVLNELFNKSKLSSASSKFSGPLAKRTTK